ncbi:MULTISPECIES: 3D domain-containing protein [unclassified Thermosipho (in: thermotogales)]|uniref:3D domain-containing protein n=1 Tax=unclassified Thermosipho (in: thermotogales) TaxID=2676525 RepID=UPI0009862046|nr:MULTISPECIES: 3D domain-containing protein [unclassified Thermosipho (in: thermotogales)]MBT1247926.1 peptidoglycan-binding protein [Thermosipho sp. 1244]OOC46115.1 peptidoglycan-binding protein [Thermosipho sp. 1223]
MAKYAAIVVLLLFLFSCNYVTYEQFSQLENRVFTMENVVEKHEKQIEELEKNYISLSKSLKRDIERLDKELKNINLENKVDYLEDFTHKLAFQISSMENQLNKVTADLTSYNIRGIIYRVNEVEGLVQKLDLGSVNALLNDAIEKYNNGYAEIYNLADKLRKLELEIQALSETLSEIDNVKSKNDEKSIPAIQIINQVEKINKLESVVNDLILKVDKISSKEGLEKELALVKQISSEISFLRKNFSREDIIDILKLRQGYISYIVRSGDSLYSISKRFNLGNRGVEKLISFNAIVNPRKIIPGQVIKIPVDDFKKFLRIPIDVDPGNILSYFGESRDGITNLGIDIDAAGSEVYPILVGRVTIKGEDVLYIDHGNGILGIYKGIETNLEENDWVDINKPLGKVKKIFHFELWVDGEPKDPLKLLFEYKGKFMVTFYTPWDDGKIPLHPTFRLTRSGKVAREWITAAIDPTLIPLGSYIYIPQLKKLLVAEDTGSLIQGKRIDIYIEDVNIARKNSVKDFDVFILKNGGI